MMKTLLTMCGLYRFQLVFPGYHPELIMMTSVFSVEGSYDSGTILNQKQQEGSFLCNVLLLLLL